MRAVAQDQPHRGKIPVWNLTYAGNKPNQEEKSNMEWYKMIRTVSWLKKTDQPASWEENIPTGYTKITSFLHKNKKQQNHPWNSLPVALPKWRKDSTA